MNAALDLLRSDFLAAASVYASALAALSFVAYLAFRALAGGE